MFAPQEMARAKADMFTILRNSPDEAQGVLDALNEGRIDGSMYEGECACLIGTIARLRGCVIDEVDGPRGGAFDVTTPAEIWFMEIFPGDTPENSEPARLAAEWIQEWIDAHAHGAKIQKGQRVVDRYSGEHGVAGARDRMDPRYVLFLADGAPNDTGWHPIAEDLLEVEQPEAAAV